MGFLPEMHATGGHRGYGALRDSRGRAMGRCWRSLSASHPLSTTPPPSLHPCVREGKRLAKARCRSSIGRECSAQAHYTTTPDRDRAGVFVDDDFDATIAPDLAALAGDVAMSVTRHSAALVQQGADRGVGAAGHRVLGDAVRRTE